MERFKAYRLTETPDRKIRAEFVDTTLDELDPGDVVVRVAYSSVNYKDALAATGKGRLLRRPSTIGGVDGATGGVGSIALAMLAKRGYHVVALTGKESESDWLKKLGAKEVMLRQSLDLKKIKPLDKATWAGAVDNLGGEVLAWMASTMK